MLDARGNEIVLLELLVFAEREREYIQKTNSEINAPLRVIVSIIVFVSPAHHLSKHSNRIMMLLCFPNSRESQIFKFETLIYV